MIHYNYCSGPDELTHVVVDPYIMSDVDPRYIDFNKFRRTWSETRDNMKGSFIYYRDMFIKHMTFYVNS